jgi:Inositol 1,3,4-trisphosphate 5/6-kinase pre-ATP-grasp domain
VELDVSRPIADQGCFVAIVHKAVGDAGERKLHAMSALVMP